jgi:CzcA family heavy metal efflux pump
MFSIIRTSLSFRYLIVILAVTLAVFGILQLRQMPIDVLPEISPPYVEIQTEALGLSAEEVEQMITVPMEQDLLAGVSWLDVIRSESVPGLSSVVIYFEPGTNIFKARQMVAERLAQAAVGLPHVSKPPTMIQPLSSTSRFLIVGLSSDQLSPIQMSVLARWTIAPRLMGVPGVANVAIWGNRDRQLQVQVDPEKLQEAGVTLQQVVRTAGNALWVSSLTYLEASTPGTGGFIDTPQQRLGIWHVLPISSPDELARVPLERTAYRLGDITNIVEDHQPLIGDAMINGDSSLLLVIEKLPGTNTLEVTQGLETALESLRPGFTEINFDATLFRPADFIDMAFANLGLVLLVSAVLVFIGLLVLQWSWRAALISFLAIPMSLLVALIVLYLRGETLNIMVLVGLTIALGIIIDEAVIDVNRIVHRLRQNQQAENPSSTQSVVLEVASGTRGSIFFATLITLLVVLPAFFMEGVSGALIRPMITSYALAVLAATGVALVLTVVFSLILFSFAPSKRSESPLILWLGQGYKSVLERSIHKPWLTYSIAAILLIASIALLPFVSSDKLIPTLKEPYITIQLEAAPGTSLPAMRQMAAMASNDLKSLSGVNDVAAHIGRAVLGDQVVNVNSAELWVGIHPDTDYASTVTSIRQVMDSYTELDYEVQTYLDQTLNQFEMNTSDSVLVRLYGEDHDVLREQAVQMQQVLMGIEGIVNPTVELPAEESSLEIEVDLSSAQRYGVKPGDVRRAAATLLSGLQVGSLFEEQKVFDVVVWGVPEIRDSVDDIGELLVDTPGGGHVRLKEVADVRMVSSPTVINRQGVSPYLDVSFDIKGRNTGSVITDIQSAIKQYAFPVEYHAELINSLAVQQAARWRIVIAAIVTLVGIFLFLQAAFRSWSLALAALLTLPVALSGGLLAAFLGSRTPLLLGLLAGFLTIFGITLRSVVMLVKHFQHLEEQDGMDLDLPLVLRGAQEWMGPILTTAFTTALAFLPFVIFGNSPGLEIVHPIAVVVLGGLVTSLLVNLFLLPRLYLQFGSKREPILNLEEKPATD